MAMEVFYWLAIGKLITWVIYMQQETSTALSKAAGWGFDMVLSPPWQNGKVAALRGVGKVWVCATNNHLVCPSQMFYKKISLVLYGFILAERWYFIKTGQEVFLFCWNDGFLFFICKSSNWDVGTQLSVSSGELMLACLYGMSLTGHACSLGLNMVMNMSNPHVPVWDLSVDKCVCVRVCVSMH